MSDVDEVMRYAFRQGPGRDFMVSPEPSERPVTSTFATLPGTVATDRMCRLVWGTVDLLEGIAYPETGSAPDLSIDDRLQHSLIMAFGLQHREPSNLFNDHRSCASVRSKFPVHAFVYTEDRAWLLDVYRHGLLPVGKICPLFPTDEAVHLALAGRYTHLPSPYGRLRGPLTELEMGISLRSLWVALEVLGLTGELRLPGPDDGTRLMARLGLDRAGKWSVPLSVAVNSKTPIPPARPAPRDRPDGGDDDDPTLKETVAVNRMSLDVAAANEAEASRGGARAVPSGISSGGLSWSEVLWQRSAGRMPRGMAGFSGRRHTITKAVVTDAVAWLCLPPPTPLLDQIARRITVTACLQDAAGFATGQYCLVLGTDAAPARLHLVRADPGLPARLEECYGHGTGPTVGCAVHQANMVWLLSIDVAALIDAIGPGGWTLAQYACGWMAHGLCLTAAAHGLYARPNRAFDEILLQPVVGLAPGEMVLLSIVSGMGRFAEPILDLRS
jgi:hypothetical protein